MKKNRVLTNDTDMNYIVWNIHHTNRGINLTHHCDITIGIPKTICMLNNVTQHPQPTSGVYSI